MPQNNESIFSWGIGLSVDQAAALQAALPAPAALSLCPATDLPALDELERTAPSLVWISLPAHRLLCRLPAADTRHLALVRRVLLLDENATLEEFREAAMSGCDALVPLPCTKKHLAGVLERVLETVRLHHDMHCMTREILLERELLERKNTLLGFLVNFLTNTAGDLDCLQLLEASFHSLRKMFPLHSMHAGLCTAEPGSTVRDGLFINAPVASPAHAHWERLLLEALGSPPVPGKEPGGRSVHYAGQDANALAAVYSGPVLTLPLRHAGGNTGVLLLAADAAPLGRDQVSTLESAMRHLALSLENARQRERLQYLADFDELTRVHTRRHLEQRLREEHERFLRHARPFSLLLLDLDHFKNVNDTYGHPTGDSVLRETGRLLAASVRGADCCARYGGEEFCVLLPDTGAEPARSLAERLRVAIERHTFFTDQGPLRITVSIGLASMDEGCAPGLAELLRSADSALYMAKAAGRNCVRRASGADARAAV